MKIATFNVNGMKGRLPRLLEWLDETQPDVACLQEIKAGDPALPARALRDAGYDSLWYPQRAHHGVAILARGTAPREVRRGLPGEPNAHQARYLEAEVQGLRIASVYLPNGNPAPSENFDFKLAWFDCFNRYAETLIASGAPVVLAGDFNVVPTDFDIYDPTHWRKDALLQPESREAYARLLAQGWTDALRELHPDERIYTFWDYFRRHWQRDAGLRIDHLLVNDVLRPRLLDAGVDRWVRGLEKASDHAPTWIRLKAGDTRRRAATRAAPAKAVARKKRTAKKKATMPRRQAPAKAATRRAARARQP